jgi:hypothetical protein
MPVNLLLCEGYASSPDARVLNRVLAGLCAIRPLGGKYGMGDRVKAGRDVLRQPQPTVFGLLDGDFPADWNMPAGRPRTWIGSDQTMLGWRWERKEIENYLIDPEVVRRALGAVAPPAGNYQAVLERARDRVSTYQAARLALVVNRPRFRPMANSFGRQYSALGHLMPDNFDEDTCLKGIRQVVGEHNSGQAVVIQAVETEFQTRRIECETGGTRFSHFLTSFAGKDLLLAMSDDLQAFGFASPAVFLEKVLSGIDNATDNVALWLAEWTTLRQFVDGA